MEDTNINITDEETTAAVSNSDSPIDNVEPFKVFNTQEDYDKFLKSESMKRVNELYKELNVNSKDDLKELLNYKTMYDEVNIKYDSTLKEYEEYKAKNSEIINANQKLSRELTLSKLGISTDEATREDFIMAVDALATKKEIEFDKAAEEFLERHPDYRESGISNLRIGGEKSPNKDTSSVYSKEELTRFPFLRNIKN